VRNWPDLLGMLGRKAEADKLWDGIIDEYKKGQISSRPDLGLLAFAAWHRDYIQDAKDFFIDATAAAQSDSIPLQALNNFGYLFLEKYNVTEASTYSGTA